MRPFPGNDCDGDGDTTNDRRAYQRAYVDANNDHVFTRSVDTSYVNHLAGCMAFHPEHNHWHFNDFADYELRSERTGALVRASTKVSFCMIDIRHAFPSLPGSPSSPYYNECGPTAPMGIAVGWSDIYEWDLPGQYIDVTGVAVPNYYCLRSTADPSVRLWEHNHSNNTGKVRILLTQDGQARKSAYPCAAS